MVTTGIIGFALASYLQMVRTQNVATLRSQAWNATVAMIEAGLEDGIAHLQLRGVTNLLSDNWWMENGYYIKKQAMGDSQYVVAISIANPLKPDIYASGYVPPPRLSSIESSGAFLAQAGSVNYPSQQSYVSRHVKVTTRLDTLFAKGMVAKGQINLNGQNIATDAFDSGDPNFSNNGQYPTGMPNRIKDNGTVATNSGLTNSLVGGNADIHGKVATGPGGSVSIGSGGVVGTRAWQAAGGTGVQPGWSTDDMNMSFPDVQPPFAIALPATMGVVGGTNYAYVLGNSNYRNDSVSISGSGGSGTVLVTGNAVWWVSGDFKMSGNAEIDIAPGASLTLFVGRPTGSGTSADLAGNGVMNAAGNATNFFFYGLPSLTSLSQSGNAAFIGAIYAPNANFTLNGSGSGGVDFIGASITKTATMNGHYNFHYDENLARVGPNRGYIVTSWNEIDRPVVSGPYSYDH